MKTSHWLVVIGHLSLVIGLLSSMVLAQDVPTADRRASELRHLDLTYEFTPSKAKEEWQARAAYLRGQILFAAGLWPLPDKTPLKEISRAVLASVHGGDIVVNQEGKGPLLAREALFRVTAKPG